MMAGHLRVHLCKYANVHLVPSLDLLLEASGKNGVISNLKEWQNMHKQAETNI